MQLRTPATIHAFTPTLTVMDARGLGVRAVTYWRERLEDVPEARNERSAFDAQGRLIAQWDPRLFRDASAPANLTSIHSLGAHVLGTDSVDAGWRVSLLGEAAQALQGWDARGSQRTHCFDDQLRPLAIWEQGQGEPSRCTERFAYGASDASFAYHNQCGQLIRHDDPAGTQLFAEFGVNGATLVQTRHFLKTLAPPDWPQSIADREGLLEPGAGASSRSLFNGAGDVLEHIDAKGHRQFYRQTLDGQLREVCLQLKGTSVPTLLLSDIAYNAFGQTEREVAGNGVVTTLQYDAEDGRLARLASRRDSTTLQNLRYAYDPVGNVLGIEDAALPIRYFANQRVEPVNRYRYDSLSQLIEASGWEAGAASQGPASAHLDDPAPCVNYRQTYHYDAGGNLLELKHQGAQSHGHRLRAAPHSNRCLPTRAGAEPGDGDFLRRFDGNGNLLQLQPGQALAWDLRNQLSEVRPVLRDSSADDHERYIYSADGMRVRKVRETQTGTRTLAAEVRYLPNLELRNHSGSGERLQVISVPAGRSSVRVLHWESMPPKDIGNDQYRYSLNDHLGSCALELDGVGGVISQERYHPFGSTAWFAGRGEVEASYKALRYSGKERDATGLYYYGFRYYLAGWQRWLNPDPAGVVDGLNGYAMVANNPVTYRDRLGLIKVADYFEPFAEFDPAPFAMAEELDHYVRLVEGTQYSESLRKSGDKDLISLSWQEDSEHYTPASEVATEITEEGVSGVYSAGFIKDLHRSDYFLHRGDPSAGSDGFSASLTMLPTLAEQLSFFADKVPDPDNRARISEVAFQVSLVPTFQELHKHNEMERYFFSDSSRARFDIHLNEDQSVTVISSTTYGVRDADSGSDSNQTVPGIRLHAVTETRIGAIDGRLGHDVLADETVKGRYELTFERAAMNPAPTPMAGPSFLGRMFGHK